ncbi:MAG TPA: hypothetical protein VKE96_14020 [Vicinamibacterales bacterium]|nr:hypothetical protein [Vicinamibacterales bacterium]
MTDAAREWVTRNLPWAVVVLLALWMPPVLYALAVDVGVVKGTGYPALIDPMMVTAVSELSLMIAALPRLLNREAAGWHLLLWSRVVVLAQTVWLIFVYTRLDGLAATLRSRAVVEAAIGLAVAAYVLMQIRPLYQRDRA